MSVPQPAQSDSYGVLCRMADGEDTIITVEATDAAAAREQVEGHRRLFYGLGDTAGRWLASRNPSDTIVSVGGAKPLAEWEADPVDRSVPRLGAWGSHE